MINENNEQVKSEQAKIEGTDSSKPYEFRDMKSLGGMDSVDIHVKAEERNLVENRYDTMLRDVPSGTLVESSVNKSIARKNEDGSVTVEARLDPNSGGIAGDGNNIYTTNNLLKPPGEVGLVGYDRAHGLGVVTGGENPYGITYAPKEVNQRDMKDLENGMRALNKQMKADNMTNTPIYVQNTVSTHERSNRLHEAKYSVQQDIDGKRIELLTHNIRVDGAADNPHIYVETNNKVTGESSRYDYNVHQFRNEQAAVKEWEAEQ